MAKKIIGDLIEKQERDYGIYEAIVDLKLELERAAEKYFDMSLKRLSDIRISALETDDPELLKLIRKTQFREDPKNAKIELQRDLKIAFDLLGEAEKYFKEDDGGRALRNLIDAAKNAGRVQGFERITKLETIIKKRSSKNRENATSKINSAIKEFVIQRIRLQPIDKKENFSKAIRYLWHEIKEHASSLKCENSWDDEVVVYERLKDWRQRDQKFEKRVDEALQKNIPVGLLPA